MNLLYILSILTVSTVTEITGFRACGDKLDELMTLVCDGHFHFRDTGVKMIKKRASYTDLLLPMSMPLTRHRRGLVEECCRKSCTISFIRTYYCAEQSGYITTTKHLAQKITSTDKIPSIVESRRTRFYTSTVPYLSTKQPQIRFSWTWNRPWTHRKELCSSEKYRRRSKRLHPVRNVYSHQATSNIKKEAHIHKVKQYLRAIIRQIIQFKIQLFSVIRNIIDNVNRQQI